MFGFGKKKYVKKFEEGHDFLQSYATKILALMNYTEQNETVTDKLNQLKEAFVFAVSPQVNKEVLKYQNNIEKMYDELREVLRSREWDENDVLNRIEDLKTELELLTSVRV